MFDVRLEQLSAFLAAVWGTPYTIGQWDCILFIAAWADFLTGSRHLEVLRGTYTTEIEARTRLAPHGLNAAIITRLTADGWSQISHPPSPISHLLPGDIILTDLDHPGIWDGQRIIAQPARAAGLVLIHPSQATGALGLRNLLRES